MSDPLTNQTSIFADKIAVWSDETKGYVEVGTGKANAVDVYSKVATDAMMLTKAPSLNPTFSGTISGISKADVGLALAENTADMAKPVSTATSAALSVKADMVDVYSMTAADALLGLKADKTTTDNSAVAWSSGTLADTQHVLVSGTDSLLIKRSTGESIAGFLDNGKTAIYGDLFFSGSLVKSAGNVDVMAHIDSKAATSYVDTGLSTKAATTYLSLADLKP